MNRPIKFRIWSEGIDKGMFYPISIFIENRGANTVFKAFGEEHTLKDDTNPDMILMQYTGLLDKNGKEIYEGDIVKLEENMADTDLFFIRFENSWGGQYKAFIIKNGKIDKTWALDNDFDRYWEGEVIGNIYENPNLLKEQK